MEIYVQSRGDSEEYDYRWLKISEQDQQLEVPSILTRSILIERKNQVRVFDLIQSEAPSVVLARDNGELLLLVTGLESTRQDFRNRKIRNSVAWVCQESDDNERFIRAIASQALLDKLREKIDLAVTFGGEYGFQVSFEEITNVVSTEELEKIHSMEPKFDKKLGKNLPEVRDALAYELEERRLPTEDGVLVTVTGIKTESALKQAGVWRGLSTLVEAEGWKEPYKKSPSPDEEVAKPSQATQKNNPIILLLLFIGSISIVAIILFLIFFQGG
jgi:hypothetical protein